MIFLERLYRKPQLYSIDELRQYARNFKTLLTTPGIKIRFGKEETFKLKNGQTIRSMPSFYVVDEKGAIRSEGRIQFFVNEKGEVKLLEDFTFLENGATPEPTRYLIDRSNIIWRMDEEAQKWVKIGFYKLEEIYAIQPTRALKATLTIYEDVHSVETTPLLIWS